LVRVTKGRNIIISSEAASAMELRSPYDAINLYGYYPRYVCVCVCECVRQRQTQRESKYMCCMSCASERTRYKVWSTNNAIVSNRFEWYLLTILYVFSGLLFGLSQGQAKMAISSNVRSVLLHAGAWHGCVYICMRVCWYVCMYVLCRREAVTDMSVCLYINTETRRTMKSAMKIVPVVCDSTPDVKHTKTAKQATVKKMSVD